ncbi:YwmB family TATA-box binding protein [Paenibacillus sp. SI8]|uniref:YwmB family TATA-box binding protein n=1 Tax=unclassified Paenibacillus TaxID=185978 RepID=UPI00346741AA
MQKFWFFSILWIAITGLIFGWVRHVEAHDEQDALRLLRTAKPYMMDANGITFKYTGYYGTCDGSDAQMLQAGKQLSRAFGLPEINTLSESNAHPVYHVKEAGVTLTVASPQGQSGCYMVLRLDANQDSDSIKMTNWQGEANLQLQHLGIQGQWNVMVQGYVAPQMLADHKNSAALSTAIAKDFNAKIVESYSDQHTVSVSLASNEFEASIKSGSQTVNVQVALHQESTTGMWRLTVGTPVITMEY